MKTLGLVTCRDYPAFQPDEQLLAPALQAHQIACRPVIWENAASGLDDISELDLLVFRSCWNYHLHTEAFSAWLDQLEARHIPVVNPVALIRWNLDKRYLLALQATGIRIVPSLFTAAGDLTWPEQALTQNWSELVIKPVVSAWGANTWRVKASELSTCTTALENSARQYGLIIQPFMPEIAEGEWSLVYYHRAGHIEFSHAFVKRPAPGAFLSHEEFGAHWQAATPDSPMQVCAQQALMQLPGEWLYARVDGVRSGDQFLLMELEVFEPSLYLAADNAAPARFARALLEHLPAV